MVVKTLIKECFKSIKRTNKRFLSLLLIVLLGVGFFAGIKVASPDMQITLNEYYKKENMYDIELISTWGITEDDINYIKEKGYSVEPTYSTDALIIDENSSVAKILSYSKNNKINKVELVEGKLPENENECVFEYSKQNTIYKIGDTITVEDENDILRTKTLTIVGLVRSPLYISVERGNTTLLTGKINYFIYAHENNFNSDYYTNAYIDLDIEESVFSKKYEEQVEEETTKLESIAKYLKETRYQEEYNKALKEVTDNENKLKKEKEKAYKEIDEAEEKIEKAEKQIKSNQKLLTKNKENFKKQKQSLNKTISTLKSNLSTVQTNLNNINKNILELEENKKSLEILISNGIDVDKNTAQLEVINNTLQSLYSNKTTLTKNKSNIQSNINKIEKEINNAQKKITSAEKQIRNAKKEIEKNKVKLSESKTKAEKEFKDAEKKITDAKAELENLKKPDWYVLDINSNIGYYSYKADSERVDNIAKVFPLVFYLVAILICLTSMTRMVEEERSEIGTLKSLGYNNGAIMFKYLLYALLASLLGSIIGVLIGFSMLPQIVFEMYKMMYDIGEGIFRFNLKYASLGTLFAVACTLLATYYSAYKALKEVPAELLRPKAPAAGKRVFLERINFIWKRLSFLQKVTYRNVFRYKKRFLMTIIGITGCTGLIVAGFGLRDCILGMIPHQYEEIYNYQLELTFQNDAKIEDKYSDIEKIKSIDKITDVLIMNKEAIEILNKDTNQSIQLIVPFSDISDFIKLQDRKTKEKFKLNDGIIISEKIANLLDVEKGDILKFKGEKEYTEKITNITENYLMHYFYMDKETYNSEDFNTLLIKTTNLTEKEEKELSNIIKEFDSVSSLTFSSAVKGMFDQTMESFQAVAVILIVSAGALAFVVLYNLANVNIGERKRELATIKVLGFNDKEVYKYISRENFILTIIGIVLGLFFGKILTSFIIKTCELDILMFSPKISIYSYIYSVILTIIFTNIVSIFTYFNLKKIEMIESLKSVE